MPSLSGMRGMLNDVARFHRRYAREEDGMPWLVQLEEAQFFRRCRVWRPADKGCKCPHVSHIVAARVLLEAAHGHVFNHARPQWADGPLGGIRGHQGSFLEPKVAGPSMLGIGHPNRHALLRLTSSIMC